tara:strand:+ start:1916 stop:2866 length:951 start_codon:yes stop_codon:yes gene_type:complete
MHLNHYIHSFGDQLKARYGCKVHKLALHAGFTCPNRDGSKGIGGCTFCNNASFSPNSRSQPNIVQQVTDGQKVVQLRTGAKKYLAYFQAYTNTYDEVDVLRHRYDSALQQHDVVGLSVGTRPDCVPDEVIELLSEYKAQGHEVWVELGLQSSNDATLERVNRGHGWREYEDAVRRLQQADISICTHLIVGLPGENELHVFASLRDALSLGTNGLKLHPLHVVKGSLLANQWRGGEYIPWSEERYVDIACELIRHTPPAICYHRVTATAARHILLAPVWCEKKWPVMNAITDNLARHGGQGAAIGMMEYSRGERRWN